MFPFYKNNKQFFKVYKFFIFIVIINEREIIRLMKVHFLISLLWKINESILLWSLLFDNGQYFIYQKYIFCKFITLLELLLNK
jgi:hypothetical protein